METMLKSPIASCSGRCSPDVRLAMKPSLLPSRLSRSGFTTTAPRRCSNTSPSSQPLTIAASASPKSSLSLQQRIRAIQFAIKEKRQALATSPPIAAVLEVIAAIRTKLQPLFDLLTKMQARWAEIIDDYNQFIADETKRKWTWSKRYSKELEFWHAVPSFLYFLTSTLLYEAMIPVSFLLAVVLPLYYAWVVWDDWWMSPVFIGMVLMLPLKFVPWAWGCFCWVWPGII